MKMNPLLIDVPDDLVRERVMLRTPRAGDGAVIFPAVQKSLGELKQWMPWATDEYNVQDAEEWCRRQQAKFVKREELAYLMFQKSDGLHLGNTSAFKIDWDVRKCEIGYWLRTDSTGQGLMTEAVSLFVKMLQNTLNFRRIEIRTDVENTRSRAIPERLKFTLEGIHRCDSLNKAGEPRDTCVYALIHSKS